ncbi:hypothetical protein JT358_14490 [Micrococcales bacterium 31B]|nr:hypothetical protein [Micrococcales bacterium 31B]
MNTHDLTLTHLIALVTRRILMYLGRFQQQFSTLVAKPARRGSAATTHAAPPPTRTTVPDPIEFAFNAVVGTMEALRGGVRHLYLRNVLSAALFDQLRRQCAFNARRRGDAAGIIAPAAHISLRTSSMCTITEAIREVTLVVQDNNRVRACAVRLERTHSSWRVTAMNISR